MRFSRKLLAALALLVTTAVTPRAPADPDVAAKLRLMSFATRDTPPALAETRALTSGATTLDALVATWIDGEEHRTKVKRFFYDMFGTAYHKLSAGLRLKKTEEGVYYLEERGTCAEGVAVSVAAWWIEPGETVKVCPNTVSNALKFGTPFVDEIVCTLPAGLVDDARCGCGPENLACMPEDLEAGMWAAMYDGFTERGLLAYDEGRTWLDLFAGDTFYGNRAMYFFYMWYGYVYNTGTLNGDDVAALRDLPLTGRAEAPFPVGGAVARAPVVTDPNFMAQYNNFRSRIRALTERLLCQDVGAALNVDDFDHFVNADLGAFNTEHGNTAGCSGCHLPMDNMGSALLAWTDTGSLYNAPFSPTSHVFGETGDGARFLMQGFVERGPGFQRCMAKRAYETFSGASFDELAAETQAEIEVMAADGPRDLIRNLLVSPIIPALR